MHNDASGPPFLCNQIGIHGRRFRNFAVLHGRVPAAGAMEEMSPGYYRLCSRASLDGQAHHARLLTHTDMSMGTPRKSTLGLRITHLEPRPAVLDSALQQAKV